MSILFEGDRISYQPVVFCVGYKASESQRSACLCLTGLQTDCMYISLYLLLVCLPACPPLPCPSLPPSLPSSLFSNICSGNQTQVFMLVKQACYKLAYFPSSKIRHLGRLKLSRRNLVNFFHFTLLKVCILSSFHSDCFFL